MSFYLAAEKLSYAVQDLVGPGDIRSRLGLALSPLTTIGAAVIGKQAAFDNRTDMVAEYDAIMTRFEKLGEMTDAQAGRLSAEILALYQRVASAESEEDGPEDE